MTWKRTTYQTATAGGLRNRRGFTNGVFAIQHDGGGFRVTHVPTGYLMSPYFFWSVKDAYAWVQQVMPLTDWAAMTVDTAKGLQKQLKPKMTDFAKRFVRGRLFSGDVSADGEPFIQWFEPEEV